MPYTNHHHTTHDNNTHPWNYLLVRKLLKTYLLKDTIRYVKSIVYIYTATSKF